MTTIGNNNTWILLKSCVRNDGSNGNFFNAL